MKEKGIIIIFICCVFLICVCGSSASASNLETVDALKCDGGTVSKGESKISVRAMCGEPTEVYGENIEETWVYNFGPTRYIYFITFTEELVSLIQSGDYGS